MTSKVLEVGDQLYSEGSWNFTIATITSIKDKVAISDIGYAFDVNFEEGDSQIDGSAYQTLDNNEWYLVPKK